MGMPAVEELNALSDEAFLEAVAPLFEGAPRFRQRLAAVRPFDSDEALLEAAREAAAVATEHELRELLDAHPRIGADPAAMSALSRDEQRDPAMDGEPGSGPGVDEDLAVLNEIYEARFGFRYVVFVAGRPRSAIAPLIEVALRNERAVELRRGVDDAIYIAADRLHRLRGGGKPPEESVP